MGMPDVCYRSSNPAEAAEKQPYGKEPLLCGDDASCDVLQTYLDPVGISMNK